MCLMLCQAMRGGGLPLKVDARLSPGVGVSVGVAGRRESEKQEPASQCGKRNLARRRR